MSEDREILAPPPAQLADRPQQLNMSADVLDMLMERARRWPRDINQVLQTAQQELEIVPDLAARSYYSIPYNKGKENETAVEGPSIKAAMTLARNWGNCFNQGRLADEDKSNNIAQGIFIDLQTGLLTLREIKISKFYKPKGAQGVVMRNADLMYMATQAGISKAARNAILASLPDWLVWTYFQHAKKIVVEPPAKAGRAVESLQVRIQKAKSAICKFFKVTPDEMEAYLIDNVDSIEDEGSLLVHLQGLYNSLKDGQHRVDDVFRPGKAAATDMPPMPQEQKK